MRKISVSYDDSTVHIFGLNGISKCSKEENLEFFNESINERSFNFENSKNKNDFKIVLSKDFWINIFDNVEYSLDMITKNYDVIVNKFELVLNHIQKNKVLYSRIVFVLGLLLSLSASSSSALMTTTDVLALTDNTPTKKLLEFLKHLLGFVGSGAIIGILCVTILRLFSEYSKGATVHQYMSIFKVSLLLLAIIFLLPFVPKFYIFLINRYLL